MPSILNRSVSLTGQSPQFQPSSANLAFANELNRSLTNVSNEMQAKSDILYTTSFLGDARKAARDIYSKNIDNPQQLSTELEAYKSGLIADMPSNLQPRLEQEYNSIQNHYVDKATIAKNKQLTIDQRLSQNEYQDALLGDLQFTARDLAGSNEGLSQDEINIKTISAFERMTVTLQALNSNISQVGPDGNPLLTPEQAIKQGQKVKEFMFKELASSWLDSQPNKLVAYGKWLNNEAVITLPVDTLSKDQFDILKKSNAIDAKGNIIIRNGMSAEVRQKVDKDLIANIKNDIFIENQKVQLQEKADQAFSDETKKILFDKAKTGELNPKIVQESKNILDYQDYRDFTKLATSASPITNGVVYSQIVDKINNGLDAQEDIRNARFNDKSISNEDFEHLLNINKQKESSALPDPVKEGRDYLLGLLGSSSQSLSIANSATLAKAERDYNGEIQDFANLNGRPPTRIEILNISEQINERYSIIKLDEFSLTLEKPVAMPLIMKTKKSQLTMENLEKVKEDTTKTFLERNNNDIKQMTADPEFHRQLKLLTQWETLVKQLEAKAASRQQKRKGGL
jgi:hypothetical protein